MRISLSRILTPGNLLLAPIVLSFIMWSIPGESLYLRGFGERAEVNMGGLLLLVAFYATTVVIAVICAAFGKSIATAKGLSRARSPEVEKRFYLIVSVSALVGVVAAYSAVGSTASILNSLSTSSANVLSENLAEGSSLATLRYATAMAAPVGIYLYRKRETALFTVIANCLLLVMNALLTSRLSLVMAIVILFFLIAQENSAKRVKLIWAALAGSALFALLAVFNLVRNGNFYRQFGIDNPIIMNLYQIVTYVGAPGQVSMGVASSIFNGKFENQLPAAGALEVLTPTFLRSGTADKSGATDPAFYGYSADIAPNLNTNSAFADTYAKYGWWGLAAIFVVLALVSVMFGIFTRIGGVYAAGAGVVGYGFAEFWRLFLFNQGISVFLIALAVVGGVAAMASTVDVKRVRAGIR